MAPQTSLSLARLDDGWPYPGDQWPGSIASIARIVRIPAGRRVFSKGEPGDGCYILINGAVKVTLPSTGAGTRLSIFMASMIRSGSPALTC